VTPPRSSGGPPRSRRWAWVAAVAGAVEIEGVRLLPTSAAFRASCRRAAGQLGLAVRCPELLPAPTAGAPPSRLCQEADAPALGGRPAVLASCRAGLQGWSAESVLLRWSRRGALLTLALRGPSEANRRLLLALAGRLPMVSPRDGRLVGPTP
jgi:hypothetical protein